MEGEFLEFVRQRGLLPGNASHPVGIGDDAAVLRWGGGEDFVVCSDLISDDVDFILAEIEPERIGRKSVAINLSDLAAMACQPKAAILTFLLPRQTGIELDALELAKQLYLGAERIATEFDCPIVGGDTNTWEGKLAISVTLLGSCTTGRPLRRDAAQVGDVICVTGPLGGSLLGHHFDFTPRVREALWLNEHCELHAGMDISDGLALDLSRLSRASQVGAELFAEQIPISNGAVEMSKTSGKTPLVHALGDGEDFELLLTLPQEELAKFQVLQTAGEVPSGIELHVLGKIVSGNVLTLIENDGQRRPLDSIGFLH
ncbi:MAG: thiamine-phosphate kinase [Pirellulaceae bacterium]